MKGDQQVGSRPEGVPFGQGFLLEDIQHRSGDLTGFQCFDQGRFVQRGTTLDESALVKALETGQIAGAVLDVFEQEPLPEGHPFWTTPNLLITFHTSAPSLPADLTNLFVENYHRFIAGKELKYQVDFERGY